MDKGEILLKLVKEMVPEGDRERFLRIAKEKIAALLEGNFARYRLRPAEINDWQKRKKIVVNYVRHIKGFPAS